MSRRSSIIRRVLVSLLLFVSASYVAHAKDVVTHPGQTEPTKTDIERWKEQDRLRGEAERKEDLRRRKRLGNEYLRGIGGKQDYVEAYYWYRTAADMGDVESKFLLGLIFAEGGYGLALDSVKATKWFLAAAMDGNAEAQLNVAFRYSSDWLTEEYMSNLAEYCDIEPSNMWPSDKNPNDGRCLEFHKIKGGGTKEDQYRLWNRKLRGDLEPDDKIAADWLRRAADQDLAQAQMALARAYADGKGVPQRWEESYFWASLAHQRYAGDQTGGGAAAEHTKSYLEKAAAHLSQNQVRRIEARTKAWKPSGKKN